jgi:acetate kinase
MRELLARVSAGDRAASAAFDVYVHRLRASIGAMAASLGGLDALVFTGGVGERSAAVRRSAVDGLEFLGLTLDDQRNERATGELDLDVAAATSRCNVLVVRAREDVEIVSQTRAAIGS